MLILSAAAAAMIASPVAYLLSNPRTRELKNRVNATLDALKIEGVKIDRVEHVSKDISKMIVTLPFGLPHKEFSEHISALEQATFSTIRFRQLNGCICSLEFGFRELRKVKYVDEEYQTGPLQIPLATPFGTTHLDLSNDSSCMVLGGGATRMGKTSLVHLVIVHSLLSTKGEIDITVCSPKIADFHMFRNVPQIKIAETPEETADAMEHVVSEMELRKEILKGYGDVKDIHSLREKHKEATLNPVLVIVDEFGAYSNTKHDSHCKRVHEYATEIACRAGYVDIHLIAFSQRTDVTQVFPPQVKNNMLCKIAFTTADENNSRLIIGTPDAAHLGAIKGRAILIDGLPELVQVPYLSEEDIITLMEPYVRSEQHDEPRQADDSVPSALPNFVSGAVGEIDLPGSSEAESDDKPNRKTPSKGRTPARRTPAKR